MSKKLLILSIGLYATMFTTPNHTADLHSKLSWSDTLKALTVGFGALLSANVIGKQIIKADNSCIAAGLFGVLGGFYAIKKVPSLLSRKNPLSSIAHEQISIDHAVTNTLLLSSAGYATKELLDYCKIASSNPADIACQILVGIGLGATIHWIKENVEKLEQLLKKRSS